MKLETSDCWQNEENFKALLMVTKIFNLSLWKVEKMSNENRAIFTRRVVQRFSGPADGPVDEPTEGHFLL